MRPPLVGRITCYDLYVCPSVCHVPAVNSTSSSAVAKRPRDASCLSVVSFSNTIPQVQFLLLVTSASDLPVRTIRFCSVVLGVSQPCCHTHDSRSTVTVYSTRPRLVTGQSVSHSTQPRTADRALRLVVQYPQ